MRRAGRTDWLHVFIDVPASQAARTREFWSQAVGWPLGEPWAQHPEFVSLVPPAGETYVHVQQVDDAPRVHVDVVVDDLDVARDRLTGMGADAGHRTERWQVMTSPGGQPFCLCLHPREGASRPGPVSWSDGHRNRLVQVCLDIPERLHARESDFWEEMTGWERRRTRFPELALLSRRDVSPVQLLLQRLGPDDAGTSVRAHIDLGTDDVGSETERVIGLGARRVDSTHPWTVLEDPAGLPFCVTLQRAG
ncbi:MAG TPA: VOC family protein [Nocardioidaceae bacterium]|nr:VOC family protein [Nocardioidaceae bacterium]